MPPEGAIHGREDQGDRGSFRASDPLEIRWWGASGSRSQGPTPTRCGDFTVCLRICVGVASDAVHAPSRGRDRVRNGTGPPGRVSDLMGSLIKKRRKRMRKKKHKKMLKRTRFQRRAKGK